MSTRMRGSLFPRLVRTPQTRKHCCHGDVVLIVSPSGRIRNAEAEFASERQNKCFSIFFLKYFVSTANDSLFAQQGSNLFASRSFAHPRNILEHNVSAKMLPRLGD